MTALIIIPLFQPLFGHGCMEPVSYQQTSNNELFSVDDSEVDVVAMATTEENLPQLATPTVNGRLLITGLDCLLMVIVDNCSF